MRQGARIRLQWMLPPVFLMLVTGMVPPESDAQLLEVEQRVFGMDCAPCAYGVERSLKKLEGVTDVNVSLNDGVVSVRLAPQNAVTLTAIRRRILDNGFTPKDAIVRISGVLDNHASPARLTTAGGVGFVLSPARSIENSRWGDLIAVRSGSTVEVRGSVEPGLHEPLSLSVTAYRRAQ